MSPTLCSDTIHGLPILKDWFAIADHDVPHIYGVATFAIQPPRPLLTAAVIAIETISGLVIYFLDGLYLLGQPAPNCKDIPEVREDTHRGRIEWARFQRLVEDLCLKVSGVDDLNL